MANRSAGLQLASRFHVWRKSAQLSSAVRASTNMTRARQRVVLSQALSAFSAAAEARQAKARRIRAAQTALWRGARRRALHEWRSVRHRRRRLSVAEGRVGARRRRAVAVRILSAWSAWAAGSRRAFAPLQSPQQPHNIGASIHNSCPCPHPAGA